MTQFYYVIHQEIEMKKSLMILLNLKLISPNRHLAFGHGAHLCLGKYLAKIEMEIFYEELFKKIDNIQLNGEPEWVKASFVSGLKSLPIKYTLQ